MPKVYGLTGGIACGKSTVSALLAKRGAAVVDADQLARDVVAADSIGLTQVVDAFGERVLRPNGTLDRAALGAVVFGDANERERLEQILHPLIARASVSAISEHAQRSAEVIVYDAALLVEQGRERHFDGLIVVACTPAIQRARLATRDGLTDEQINERLASQLPIDDKVAVADFVVRNDGDLMQLQAEVDTLWTALR